MSGWRRWSGSRANKGGAPRGSGQRIAQHRQTSLQRGHSIEMNGTVTVRRVWEGRAQLEEIEADGPSGHWQGLTLFLYNPETHQWSQSFASSKTGVVVSPLIGEFKNGRGELISQDTFGGRTVLVRGVWSDIKPDSHRFEESYSDDGGRTW